jgi:riboflavin transporter FmnP
LKQNKKSILDYLISGIIGLVLTAIIYSVFYYVFRLPL